MNEIILEFIKGSPIAGAMVFVCWMLFKQLKTLIDNIAKLADQGHDVMRRNTETLASLKTMVEKNDQTIQRADKTMDRLHEKLCK